MIRLQFRDATGKVTQVSFFDEGEVKVMYQDTIAYYFKGSPIADMYHRMLHYSRKVENEEDSNVDLYQVVGAW